MIYWELWYRVNKVGHPCMTIMFNDEKHAISSLRKFYGDDFDKFRCIEHTPRYREWINDELHGIDALVASLTKIEVRPHARAIPLPTEDKAA